MVTVLRQHPSLAVGLAIALVITGMAGLAPVIAPYDPASNDFGSILGSPSARHLLGTDDLGRDVLSRLVFGARISIEAGVLATLLAFVVAIPLGVSAGYLRGLWDSILMRLADTMLAFPFLIIAVGMAAILGPSLQNAILAVGIVQVPKLARISRGEVMSLREEPFVEAAIADGAPDRSTMLRHILPNAMNMILVQATIILPNAILSEATLSFLGLGVQPPTPSWGVMLTTAQPYLYQDPWLSIIPGVMIVITVLGFNLLGDGLRDVLDPRIVR
jgi:ABC-type dipeptide/oligopeptide/nickel transport system permease subunit